MFSMGWGCAWLACRFACFSWNGRFIFYFIMILFSSLHYMVPATKTYLCGQLDTMFSKLGIGSS